jgi:hypothetical protein
MEQNGFFPKGKAENLLIRVMLMFPPKIYFAQGKKFFNSLAP